MIPKQRDRLPLYIAAGCAAALLVLGWPAFGQAMPETVRVPLPMECGERKALEDFLREKFGERLTFAGVGVIPGMVAGKPFYAWSGPDGSWTLMMVTGETACIVAAGRMGMAVDPERGEEA